MKSFGAKTANDDVIALLSSMPAAASRPPVILANTIIVGVGYTNYTFLTKMWAL